ncbi:MAG: peptidoglycan editing factor PgeF [Cellulosilyticaceae bacterium]
MKATQTCKIVNESSTPYLVFRTWEKDTNLIHGFSTKHGGVSTGALKSLNLGFNRGDQPQNVKENYKLLCASMGIPYESLVISKQVHETLIEKVTYKECGNGILYPNKWESADGIYTDEADVALVTHYADCVPLFFYAPSAHLIGLAHAGWRGTVGEIGPRMIKRWIEEEGVDVTEVEVAIGPSIGPCCFEVHEDVALAFTHKFKGQESIVVPIDGGKYQVNLWEYNRQLLLEVGVRPEKIHQGDVCTCCNHETFYSHRYTQGKRGTLSAIMYLRK